MFSGVCDFVGRDLEFGVYDDGKLRVDHTKREEQESPIVADNDNNNNKPGKLFCLFYLLLYFAIIFPL